MRLIDAEALMQKLSRMIDYCKKDTKVNAITALFQVGDAIMDAPTIEAKPVVHAHWEGGTCSHCKLPWNYNMTDNGDDWGYFDPMPDYCCNCGAQMDDHIADAGKKGVKIPVYSMEDVPKIIKEE